MRVEGGSELFGGESFGLVVLGAGQFGLGGVAGNLVFAGQADEGGQREAVFEGLFEAGDPSIGVSQGPLGYFLAGCEFGGAAVAGEFLGGALGRFFG